MILLVVGAGLFVGGFMVGAGVALLCYPDKQEIIDRIKRERGAS